MMERSPDEIYRHSKQILSTNYPSGSEYSQASGQPIVCQYDVPGGTVNVSKGVGPQFPGANIGIVTIHEETGYERGKSSPDHAVPHIQTRTSTIPIFVSPLLELTCDFPRHRRQIRFSE